MILPVQITRHYDSNAVVTLYDNRGIKPCTHYSDDVKPKAMSTLATIVSVDRALGLTSSVRRTFPFYRATREQSTKYNGNDPGVHAA